MNIDTIIGIVIDIKQMWQNVSNAESGYREYGSSLHCTRSFSVKFEFSSSLIEIQLTYNIVKAYIPTRWWFDTCIYCKIITTIIRLVNAFIISHGYICVCLRTLKICSLGNFQVYSTVLLTTLTTLYIGSPELIHLITGSLYLLTNISPSPLPSHLLATSNLLSFCYEFGFFKISHTSEIIQYLSFSVWLISLSIMPPRSIYVFVNGRIFFLFYG